MLTAWMSGPKVAEAHYHTLSLVLASKREIRAFDFEGKWRFFRGSSGAVHGGKKEKILWVKTPKGKSLLGRLVLGLEEEEEEVDF